MEAKQAESGKWSQRTKVTQSGHAKMAGDYAADRGQECRAVDGWAEEVDRK